jgi:hypothetical protein
MQYNGKFNMHFANHDEYKTGFVPVGTLPSQHEQLMV